MRKKAASSLRSWMVSSAGCWLIKGGVRRFYSMTAMESNAFIAMRLAMRPISLAKLRRCSEFCRSFEHLIKKASLSFWPLGARWDSGLYFEALSCFQKPRSGLLKTGSVRRRNISPRKRGSHKPCFQPILSRPSFKRHSKESCRDTSNRNHGSEFLSRPAWIAGWLWPAYRST